MGKYYAVRNGVRTGIFKSWDETKKYVLGFSNAEYKSFKDRRSAENYISEGIKTREPSGELSGLLATVEHYKEKGKRTFGYRLTFEEEGELINYTQRTIGSNLNPATSVTAELEGALEAIRMAKEMGYKQLTIVYEFDGVKQFALGAWRPKKKNTISYTNEFLAIKGNMNVLFLKYKEKNLGRTNN